MAIRFTPEQITAWVYAHFEVKPRKNGVELRINSPFDDDSGWNFNISTEKARCHDWRGDEWAGPPNAAGKRNCTFVKFVSKYLNCSAQEAIKSVLSASSDSLPVLKRRKATTPSRPLETPLVTLPGGSEKLAACADQTLAQPMINWLASRGITLSLVEKYDIHYFVSTAIWPYYEYEILVYWQSRQMMDKIFRFPDEQEFGVTKGQFLYNFDNVEPATEVVVTEAIFGAMTLGDQTVATGGADMTPQQIRKVSLLGPRRGIVLAPDNDTAGIKSIIANGQALARHNYRVFYSLPPKIEYKKDDKVVFTKDWNELYTGPRISFAEIRRTMESGIVAMTRRGHIWPPALLKLQSLLNASDKTKPVLGSQRYYASTEFVNEA